jgi:prophage maintenance system killer protein
MIRKHLSAFDMENARIFYDQLKLLKSHMFNDGIKRCFIMANRDLIFDMKRQIEIQLFQET